MSYLEKYVHKQKYLLISTYKKLSIEFLRAEKLKNSLQTIINELDEAIISINKQNKVVEFNTASEELLGLKRKNVLYKDLAEILEIKGNVNETLSKNSNIITINNKQVYINHLPPTLSDTFESIYTLKEIKKLQKNEEHIRRILYKKDYAYQTKYTFNDIIAKDNTMIDIISNAKSLSISDATILITGESGTGKEILAQSIHNESNRRNQPFIPVNFAAMNDNLIESELFGYEEGAFTGAKKSGKKGMFELAHNGTIFLDEIGDSSLWVQSRLLRVLEEKEIMRLGDTKLIPVNVRVIVATNKNLLDLIEKGDFRNDLYYRLNVFKIHIPPLRSRQEDIQALINSFMNKYNIRKSFSQEAFKLINQYTWPGNIRELKNMVEYISVKAQNEFIDTNDLPYDISNNNSSDSSDSSNEIIIDRLTRSFEISAVKYILYITEENKTGTTKMGRNRMREFLNRKNLNFSESRLKTLLNHLKNYDLIHTGKTKQGTIITKRGEEFLSFLENGSK
jgi:transcriptional regulator with PAS, ATPase and Fis domain